MADSNDSLLREVDDEIRREKLAKLWDQYGLLMLTAAAMIVAGVLGFQWWQRTTLENAQAFGAKYQNALLLAQQGKAGEAAKIFSEIAANGPKGYAVLARIKLAGGKVKAGKGDEAVKLYDAVINDGGADELLAGYARLQAASLRAGKADWTEMQNRLNDLAKASSPWRYSAKELLGIAARHAGKLAEARKYFEQLLADPLVPRSISARVRVLLSLVTEAELASAAKKKPAAAAATATATAATKAADASKPGKQSK